MAKVHRKSGWFHTTRDVVSLLNPIGTKAAAKMAEIAEKEAKEHENARKRVHQRIEQISARVEVNNRKQPSNNAARFSERVS